MHFTYPRVLCPKGLGSPKFTVTWSYTALLIGIATSSAVEDRSPLTGPRNSVLSFIFLPHGHEVQAGVGGSVWRVEATRGTLAGIRRPLTVTLPFFLATSQAGPDLGTGVLLPSWGHVCLWAPPVCYLVSLLSPGSLDLCLLVGPWQASGCQGWHPPKPPWHSPSRVTMLLPLFNCSLSSASSALGSLGSRRGFLGGWLWNWLFMVLSPEGHAIVVTVRSPGLR